MGTRSLIHFYQGDKEVACVYQQFDGYPSGAGMTLGKFLASGRVVNGISYGTNERVFNGVGCMAAQFIADNKKEAGGLYLYPCGSTDCGEEYVYEVRGGYDGEFRPQPVSVICRDTYGGGELYSGDVEGFLKFCETADE